jgi:hypothetical protein
MTGLRFVVRPQAEEWTVVSGEKVLERHATRGTAFDAGVRWARANRPSELVVLGHAGWTEHRRTFGEDPACTDGCPSSAEHGQRTRQQREPADERER